MATYRVGSFRRASVQKKLAPKTSQLGVFLALSQPEGERDRRQDDDQLPSPEVNGCQQIVGGAGFAQALSGVINPGKHHVSHESEDSRVGVERAKAPETQP
jgi:hypothetical protein